MEAPKKWSKDKTLIFAGICRKCGKLHKIKNENWNMNCQCGQNIIWFNMINHMGIEVIFKNQLLKTDSVKNFSNRWKK